jgi:hypothetical protein
MADPPHFSQSNFAASVVLRMISEKTSGDRSTKCFLDEPLQE